jgi:hypothetical protein
MHRENKLRQEVATQNVRTEQVVLCERRLGLLYELEERLTCGIRSERPGEHCDDDVEPKNARRNDPRPPTPETAKRLPPRPAQGQTGIYGYGHRRVSN